MRTDCQALSGFVRPIFSQIDHLTDTTVTVFDFRTVSPMDVSAILMLKAPLVPTVRTA